MQTPRHLIHQIVEDEASVALLIKLGNRLWKPFDKDGASGQLIQWLRLSVEIKELIEAEGVLREKGVSI